MSKTVCVCVVLIGVTVCLMVSPAVTADAAKAHKTDWLYKAKWGVMFHYQPTWQKCKTFEEWDKAVTEFDAEGLARQFKAYGAGYLLITSRHGGEFPLAPNSVIAKSKSCPKRDLIADLADALDTEGLHLMLYYSTGMCVDKPKTAQNTAAVITEWSKRYGKKVKGWWLDNNCGDKELQKLIADACRSGNPDTLVAFSPPKMPKRNSPYEDYTAGNTHAPGYARCGGRFTSGAQWHMLSYVGNNWGGYCRRKGLRDRWSVGKVCGFTRKFVSRGGVVTWDVKPTLKGLIAPEFDGVMKAIGKSVADIKR